MPFSMYRKGRKGDASPPPDFFIAVLSNSARPCVNTAMSLIDSAVWMEENDFKFDLWFHTEDCHVDDARNFLVTQFMNSGAPYMVFIDDDVGWEIDAFARLLLFEDADIVGGCYPLKQRTEDYPIRIKSTKEALQARPDGLLEVEGVPTGFMRISRKVIEALFEKRKHLAYLPKEAKEGDQKLHIIFERMMVEGRRWSGDLNFCREARQLGFKVWVDPEMSFTHQGQMRWEGHLGNYLRKKNGILDSRLDAAMERLITGDTSPDVFNKIWQYHGNDFACGPKMLSEVYAYCQGAKGPILECGSGISTIVGGIACQRNGQFVHALEHDLEWYRLMRNFINLWKVRGVKLYYAPLKEYPEFTLEGKPRPLMWYDIDGLPEKFDVAIVDGPPRRYGREGFYEIMLPRVKEATWIVDDVDDPYQFSLVKQYAEGRDVRVVGNGKENMRHYAVVS